MTASCGDRLARAATGWPVQRPVGECSDRASEGDVRAAPRRRVRPEQQARGEAGASEVFARVLGLKQISSRPRRAARAGAYPRVRSSDRSLRLALLIELRQLGPMTPSTYARTAVETILCVSELEIECIPAATWLLVTVLKNTVENNVTAIEPARVWM
jgi:hypothetical protein